VSSLRLTLLTPLATVFDGAIDALIVPLADGWKGILPGHAPFQARLLAGNVLVRIGAKERVGATLGGALTVEAGTVRILSGVAALDTDLKALERGIDDELRRLTGLEQEAEKHFEQIYRQMARTFNHRGRRHA
jgi:F-type H+-transporting ATPase subunit epsilon